MSDRTTINVSKESHRKASEAKKDGETWGEYLERCAKNDEENELMNRIDDLETEIKAQFEGLR